MFLLLNFNNYFFQDKLTCLPKMNTKKSSSYRKGSNCDQSNPKKNDDDGYHQKIRVIQNNLVFINGLPSDLSAKQVLETDIYFGRYGKVLKSILNPPQPYKKNFTYQAYVTYESQLDASLAIVALDGFKLSQRPLKVSYGTTKYCSHFLKGYQCPNTDCFYLHKFDKKREIVNGDTREVFKQQNNTAVDIVCDNLKEVVNRSLKQDKQQLEGFPTLSQMLDFLVQNNVLTTQQIESTKKQQKKTPNEQNIDNKSNSNSPKSSKLLKNDSFSTLSSPVKQQFQKKQNQIVEKIQDEFRIQQKIEKLIIKQILKNNTQCKSRFEFVNLKNQYIIDQCNKIKGIVQKCLIAKN